MLDTGRMILTQRNKAILASITLALSSFAYNITIKLIADADGWMVTTIASVASGIGCFLAILFADKYFKEVGVRVILSDKKEVMQAFRDYLASKHVTNIALDSYTHGSWENKSITIIAVPNTRDKNSMIDEYAKTLKEQGIKVKII